jgi:1-phosphatidylinositol-4-phosphate 5-kinase
MSDDFYLQQYQDSLSVIASTNHEIIYYFGIIDILTNFNTKKKLEYVAKRITLGPTISAIPP